MKTLDEIIKAMSICKNEDINRTCEGCPIPDTEMCINELMTDALQWLKGYKAHIELDKLRDKYGVTSQNFADTSQITCPKCHSEFVILSDANNPLTWDELKSMEGNPVWVESISCKRKVWAIVDCFYTDAFGKVNMNVALPHDYWHLEKELIGKTWQAYRKER